MIDLHLHTTASDGRSTPEALVTEARAAGCRTIAVTDHDTVASAALVQALGRAEGLDVIAGIEMTAVDAERDIHILGYFLDIASADLETFLVEQRTRRRARMHQIARRLAELGAPVDLEDAVAAARASGRAIGRPAVAAALVAAGHVASIQEAFDRYLAHGRPAHVRREGASPAEIIGRIRAAGGVASLAHPGKNQRDDLIAPLVQHGLAALEVFHPDHAPDDVARYGAMAADLGLLITGGSDYHGPGSGRTSALGQVTLPDEHFQRLTAYAARSRPS
jgi:3',5'-nucleoside bisphosphate phosphatase